MEENPFKPPEWDGWPIEAKVAFVIVLVGGTVGVAAIAHFIGKPLLGL